MIKSAGVVSVVLCLVSLAACGTTTPTSAPTIDLDPFRTEVAATVLAQVKLTQARLPTLTSTPSPTASVTPTESPTLQASPSPSPVVTGTLTSATSQPGVNNRAQWVSQTIADGTVFTPGETFTMTWRLKNVGTSIWMAAYLLRYYSGETFSAPKEAPIGVIVLPNETLEITLVMKAPTQPGNYRTDWVLSDENRSNFKDPVFLKITVAPLPTSTPRPSPTVAATPQ